MSKTSPVIFWYRQDLRLDDLPGLAAAAATGRPVLPCYILDDRTPGDWSMGGASHWWLHHSLNSLAQDLAGLGGQLVLRRGESLAVLEELVKTTGAPEIFCTRMYEPWAADLERRLHEHFTDSGIQFKRFAGSLLHEPEAISNQSGKPYKVFTPFWRRCLAAPEPPVPTGPRGASRWFDEADTDDLSDWNLCPAAPNWASGWERLWQPGSAGAQQRVATFLQQGIEDYSEGRNHPAKDTTSRLSPHLHFGEVSPRQVWHTALQACAEKPGLENEVNKFFSELGWREFSHHLMHHFPHITEKPFKTGFERFPWVGNQDHFEAWKHGMTGYPIVDAGMRELWETGYMHNRVRMIVASFLTKHLLIHWRKGADWFWDTLLDADLANNSCGWQWVAGSGADASPYFRIFNPITQGKKFDASGAYIRQWVPELSPLPDRYLFAPWEAPSSVLEEAAITMGEHYPLPIVDHKLAREMALSAYASLADQ